MRDAVKNEERRMNLKICLAIVLSLCVIPGMAKAQTGNSAQSRAKVTSTSHYHDRGDEVVTVRIADHFSGHRKHFVKFAQCQIEIQLEPDGRGLWRVRKGKEADLHTRINACISQAASDHADVLIMPELALAFPSSELPGVLADLRKTASGKQLRVNATRNYEENQFDGYGLVRHVVVRWGGSVGGNQGDADV
jgi:hypothetical protein